MSVDLFAGSARATEGGVSLYVPGLRGPLAGVTPPPGFYFDNDAYYYYGELPNARRLQIGGAVVSNVKQRAYVDFVTPLWVTPLEILGGNLAFSVTVPFGAPYVSAGAVIAAPRLGRAFGFKQRDQDLTFGDPVASSFIGWHSGNAHWQAGVSVNIPAGAYQEGELSNVAFNRWIGDVYGALTYLDPATGLDISGSVGFEINGENDATDYDSGNAFHADLAISKSLTKELSVGFLASHYQQFSDDGGEGDRVGPNRGRVTALGGTVGYNFLIGQTPVSTRIKVLREVETDNRFKGTVGLFTVSFPLGGQAPPAAPVTAKY
ncbi:hypothetical protein DES45_107100 [Microvirga subterranea]|uniref:Uncharacterized protein n=1 Tax=Microvirga subterranea TaxID=186651 RepID=A0A370HIF8_9HYPH|nr:hypothetical protein DES45_107100 [Microvirga subterranea]